MVKLWVRLNFRCCCQTHFSGQALLSSAPSEPPCRVSLAFLPLSAPKRRQETPAPSPVWTRCKKAGAVMLKILPTRLVPGLSVNCVLTPTLKSISPYHSPVFLSSFPLVSSPAASLDREQPPSGECTLCSGSLCSHLPSRFADGYHVLSFGLLLPCPFGGR